MAGTPRMSAVLLREIEELRDGVDALVYRQDDPPASELAVLRMAQAVYRRALANDLVDELTEQMSGPDGLEGVRARRTLQRYYRNTKAA